MKNKKHILIASLLLLSFLAIASGTKPASALAPIRTPVPTRTSVPTKLPPPTNTVKPTKVPAPTKTAQPTKTLTPNGPGSFTMDQTLSDKAQEMTIAFDGLAFLTGNLGSDSFFPPGKVADFWGFQYLRDNDPSGMGHNTDFL
ncbi:MAG: hypothetical protein NT121_22960, partial [Chloroflexi bacterium]|nr:hypothetical protein [Chloroflexota bacterium]